MPEGERRLAAIMFTDMVGYTALGQRNEQLSLALVEEQRKLIRPILARHDGKEVKTMGDSFLVEFPSALEAVRSGYEIQRAARELNVPLPDDKRIHLRVGVHVGDIVESGRDISGDAVNVASRIEAFAEDGGVCLTRQVYDHVNNKFELRLENLGWKQLKNVSTEMEVFKMVMPWEQEKAEPLQLDTTRIAILPFTNMSPDPQDEYFSDGMTEELISTVSGIGGLSVISRTSVMKFKGGGRTVSEIGRELKAGTILEGSVRKADNFVRVTAQLIDVNTDRHLWSQNYDRELKNIFALQSDIARQVADSLRVRIVSPEMARIERKPTESTTAYALYLRGRARWNKRGIDDLKKAMEYFALSVHEDPEFALGYAGQADCCIVLRNNWNLDLEENLDKAKKMVAKALELDPGLAEAHATRGLVLRSEFNLREAEEAFRRAIELKPSYASAHQWLYLLLLSQLRWDEALKQLTRALELDPLSPQINLNLGQYYIYRREYDKAVEPSKRAAELGLKYAHSWLGSAYGRMEMFAEMKGEFTKQAELLQDIDPYARKFSDLAIAYFEGDKKTVRSLLLEFETHIHDTGISAYTIASFHFYLGDIDQGFEWLERSYARREDGLYEIAFDWELDRFRDDPRYIDLAKRIGLVNWQDPNMID